MNSLDKKITAETAIIGIIGLGYVGLPLAVAFTKYFSVIGYDVNNETIAHLKSGKSHILDVSNDVINKYLNKSFIPTDDADELKKCAFLIICVPTPLSEDYIPNLNYIKGACNTITKILKGSQFVILESTSYPGTTEEVVVPILERNGLKAGVDFGVAYSPERIDPGNKSFNIQDVPKIVGGLNQQCTDLAVALYKKITCEVIPVENTRTAESVKMVENIFRSVNIALVNELALIFERMNINTWDVIDAAASKPYGFMPFYPGPGIGGHCIPLDPYYLSYKAKKFGFIPRFIETSGEINEFMKIHVVNLTETGLKKVNKNISGAKIAVIGLAYKKNIDDTRESPAIHIIEELVRLGANVNVYDPYVLSLKTKAGLFTSEKDISVAISGSDCAIFLVDHDIFRDIKLRELTDPMLLPVIIDAKNMFEREDGIVYMGLGKDNSRE